MLGKIKRYGNKGFGYIDCDELKSDVYFSREVFFPKDHLPLQGELVDFELSGQVPSSASRVIFRSAPRLKDRIQLADVDHQNVNVMLESEQPANIANGSLAEIEKEILHIPESGARRLLRSDFGRISRSTETFDDRLQAANFQRRLSSMLLEHGQLDKAQRRAKAAFDAFVALQNYSRFKKSLSACAEICVRCFVKTADSDIRSDLARLKNEVDVFVESMFAQVGIIPRDLIVKSAQILLRASEEERLRVAEDIGALGRLLAKSYPTLWKLPTGPQSDWRILKDQWQIAARSYCPEIADEVAFSSAEELGLQLGQWVEDLVRAKKDPQCTMPEHLATTLHTIADHVGKDFDLRASFQPIVPLKKPLGRKRSAGSFDQAFRQVSQLNYRDAELSLSDSAGKDPTSAALWEWLAYVRLILGRDDLAESHLKLAQTYAEPDITTNWNLACALYRSEDAAECLEVLARCERDEATDVALAVAVKHNVLDKVLDKLRASDDLQFLIVGYCFSYSRKDYSAAKDFLDPIIKKLRALNDSFETLPIDEELDEEDANASLAHFLQYDQIDKGIAHFRTRLDRNQRPVYALLSALGQLYDRRGNIEDALSCFIQECDKTLTSRASIGTKLEALYQTLDFCVRRGKRDSGLELLDKHGSLLSDDIRESYRQRVNSQQGSAWVPTGKEAGAGTKAEPSERQPAVASSSQDEPVRNANTRIAELNRKYGTIDNMEHVRQVKDDLLQYCDCVRTVYGSQARKATETARLSIEALCRAAEVGMESERRLALNQARSHLVELDKDVSMAIPESQRHELVVFRKLKVVLGNAEVRAGLVKDPVLELLSTSIPAGRAKSALFVRLRNEGQVPVDEVLLSAKSEKGAIEVSAPDFGISLGPKDSHVLALDCAQIEKVEQETVFLSLSYSAGGVRHSDRAIQSFTLSVQPFTPIPLDRYIVGSSVPATRPENFHGREDEIQKVLQYIEAARKGMHGVIFLDGIKQVGKSSLLNFITGRLGATVAPVRLSMMGKDLTSTADVLHMLAREVCLQTIGDVPQIEEFIGTPESFQSRPIDEFRSCFRRVREAKGNCNIVLIIDEVQELIKAIAGAEKERLPLDSRVLNAWQAALEEDGVLFILTGSLRYNRIAKFLSHSLFRRVNRLPIGFLSRAATVEALTVPVKDFGVTYSDEALDEVWNLTHGYASIVQRFGLACLERLNANGRYIVTPVDIEEATAGLLSDAQLFHWWWDREILGEREDSLMRTFLHLQDKSLSRGVQSSLLKTDGADFGSETNVVINTLCEQEILEFEKGRYSVKGGLLEEWLSRKLSGEESFDSDVLKYCILAVDHENFVLNLKETLSRRHGVQRLDDETLRLAIRQLVEHVKVYGDLVYPFSVAVWNKGYLSHRSLYEEVEGKFETLRPAQFKKNATDSEIRRAIIEKVESEVLGRKSHGTVILVAGDRDYKDLVDRLKKQGRRAIVWAWECSLSRDRILANSATRFESLDGFITLRETAGGTAA